MNNRGPVKRAYDATRRNERAASTRLTIIETAADRFVADGYGSTSIDAVAEAAGASRATVFSAVGGKAALLRAAYDVALVGDDEPIPLPGRPWARPVLQAADAPTMLTRYAHMVTVVDGRVAGIWEVMRGAASAHADVRDHWEQIHAERVGGARNVVRMLLERGGRPRPPLTKKTAADIVTVLIDPGLYQQLVHQQHWQPATFEAWLAQTFRTQLLV